MVCSMVKKGLLGAALGAGTLFLVFGTSAPSYVKTAFHKMRQTAKDSIDPRFEIDRARTEIASLEPAFNQNKETLARAEVAAERLQKEIGEVTGQPGSAEDHDHGAEGPGQERRLPPDRARRRHRRRGQGPPDQRVDHVQGDRERLEGEAGAAQGEAADDRVGTSQLENLRTQKATLLTQLAKIEARLQSIQAAQANSEFNFDDSALARAKEAVANLEERLDFMAHKAVIDDKYGDIDGKSRPASIRTATWSRKSMRCSARRPRPSRATRACERERGTRRRDEAGRRTRGEEEGSVLTRPWPLTPRPSSRPRPRAYDVGECNPHGQPGR